MLSFTGESKLPWTAPRSPGPEQDSHPAVWRPTKGERALWLVETVQTAVEIQLRKDVAPTLARLDLLGWVTVPRLAPSIEPRLARGFLWISDESRAN